MRSFVDVFCNSFRSTVKYHRYQVGSSPILNRHFPSPAFESLIAVLHSCDHQVKFYFSGVRSPMHLSHLLSRRQRSRSMARQIFRAASWRVAAEPACPSTTSSLISSKRSPWPFYYPTCFHQALGCLGDLQNRSVVLSNVLGVH